MPPFRKKLHVRQRAELLFKSHWRPKAVARDNRCSTATAYRLERNIGIYGDTRVPRPIYGPSRCLTLYILDVLLEY